MCRSLVRQHQVPTECTAAGVQCLSEFNLCLSTARAQWGPRGAGGTRALRDPW